MVSCSNKYKTGGETAEIGNFPPPEGTYKETEIGEEDDVISAVVSKVDKNTTKIKGKANGTTIKSGRPRAALDFDFNISKWKKTKTTFEAVAGNITDAGNYDNKDAVIIYYSDTQTLKITFTFVSANPGWDAKGEFNGIKQP